MTIAAPRLRVVESFDRGELEMNTALVRRFLGVVADEPIELTAFVGGRIHVAHATTAADHVRLLRQAQQMRDFTAAYQLVNGPVDPNLTYRYAPLRWHRAMNGRATDRDIQALRAVFLDVDVMRPKGISSTNEELNAACEVSRAVEAWFADTLGSEAPIGHGCSGNGFYTLLAIEPVAPTAETTRRISGLLGLLQKKFGTNRVKIDTSVANPARLMPAPGTMKCKGIDAPERAHRETTFMCAADVQRVPLEALC